MKITLKVSLLSALIIFSNALLAEEAPTFDIPVIERAQVFAQFTDRLPAVVNYFSDESEEVIISFYQEIYGEKLSQERKRERLTVYFNDENNNIRVIISQQNNKRQVDVLMTQK